MNTKVTKKDIRIALALSKKAWRYRNDQFLKYNTNPRLQEFFSCAGSKHSGDLNIRTLWGTQKDPIWCGEYWCFTDSATKQAYSKLIPDLYLFLSKMDEENLEYKFIEISERQFLIRGSFKSDIVLQTRIFPFEVEWISI